VSRRETVIALLATVSGVDPSAIDPEMDLVADLQIDSPKALRLLVEIEDALDIEIPDDDAAGIRTVEDLLGYVERLSAA